MIRYFEIGFGYKEDEFFRTGDYIEDYHMAIKADHYRVLKRSKSL